MATKAQAGRGSKLAIGAVTGTGGTETFTPIGEVKEASLGGSSFETEDVSNFDSGIDMEFITTMRNPGEITLSGNRVSSDTGQIALKTAWDSGSLYDFKLTLPKTSAQTTTGDVYAFTALVTKLDQSVQTKNANTFSCTLKISGTVVLTAGS